MLSENCIAENPKHISTLSEINVKTNLSKCKDVKIVKDVYKTVAKRGVVHLSHGLHGIGNGCHSVHTKKTATCSPSRFTSAALITKCHSQHSDGSGFTKLSQYFGQSSFLRREARCLLFPLMKFVTTDHPYMRDIIQKPLWQHVPHYWFAIVIMIQPFQIIQLCPPLALPV